MVVYFFVFKISTLETTRICIDCFTILKNTLDMIKKAKELERLFEGLLQENDSDLTIKRLNAYRAHFQLQSMISEDIFKEEIQNDQKEEEEVYESLRYIELDVDQDDHNDTEYVDSNLVQQDQTILKLEELSQDVEIITEMEQSEVSLITQDEDYDIEGESYDEQFVEVVVSVQTSDNNSIVKTDVEKMFTFQCHLCSHEEFTNMKLLSRHCREVHNALPMVKCCSDECESVLSTWRRLMIHKDKHFPHDDQIKCNECQKVYLSAARLERHMLSHKVRFYCDQCGREFKEAKVLRTHELTHTVPLEERRNLFCTHDGCDKRFSSKQALQNHIAMRHDQQVTNHCKVPGCGRSFFARKAYNSHMRGVHGERKFACDECNFKATTKSALSNHSVSHKVGEKRFKCDMCNASFLILRRLRNHMSKSK